MPKISVLLNTIPEELDYLPQALVSLKGFADEIVVVYMGGKRDLDSLSKKFKFKVFEHERVNYVEPVRNFAISKATGDWIFIMDPDEEVQVALINKLKEIAQEGIYSFLRIPRKNIVFGKWIEHSRWWPDMNIRFFKKGAVSWNELIHGVPLTEGDGLDLEAKEELAIVHHNYPSIKRFLEHLDRYTDVQSDLKHKEGYVFVPQDIIKKPLAEFLSRYFAGQGYKDGMHGLALAGLQSFSEFVLYLKLWEKGKFTQTNISIDQVTSVVAEAEKETHYWLANAKVEESGDVVARLKRKLKLL